MRTAFLGALTALATSALVLPSGAAAAGKPYWRDCGERVVAFALIIETEAHKVPCKRARKVADKYAFGDRDPLGFKCRDPRPTDGSGGEVMKGVCRRGERRVRVTFGI